MSRRVLLLGAGFVLMALAVLLAGRLLGPPDDQVRVGMTLGQVEAILGGPASHETPSPDVAEGGTTRIWRSRDGSVIVRFCPGGTVAESPHARSFEFRHHG